MLSDGQSTASTEGGLTLLGADACVVAAVAVFHISWLPVQGLRPRPDVARAPRGNRDNMMLEQTETVVTDAGSKRPAAGAVLHCVDLRKSFGDRRVVDVVGFSIAPGETFGLLGPNGAGKY